MFVLLNAVRAVTKDGGSEQTGRGEGGVEVRGDKTDFLGLKRMYSSANAWRKL